MSHSHFPVISAAHAALRAVVADTTTATLDQLDTALANLPLTEVTDGTERLLNLTLELIGSARDHTLFHALQELEAAVTAMPADPALPVHNNPAVQATFSALDLCYRGAQHWSCDGSYDGSYYQAWDRATLAGCNLLRAVSGFLYESEGFTHREVTRRLETFSADARRAVAYHARDLARTALTVIAEDYGLFVIGARTADREPHTWLRYLGRDTYRFEVTPPDFGGAPAGWLIVISLKTGKRVHKLALSTEPARRLAVADALYLI